MSLIPQLVGEADDEVQPRRVQRHCQGCLEKLLGKFHAFVDVIPQSDHLVGAASGNQWLASAHIHTYTQCVHPDTHTHTARGQS